VAERLGFEEQGVESLGAVLRRQWIVSGRTGGRRWYRSQSRPIIFSY